MEFEDVEDIPWVLSDGVPWIHADWPAYPMGDTWQAALINLGSFPEGTTFTLIDYIDRAILLRVQGFGDRLNEFDERGFHIAVWDENIKELWSRGLVHLEDIEFGTRRKYEEFYRNGMRKEFFDFAEKEGMEVPSGYDPLLHLSFEVDGKPYPLKLPSLEVYEDDEPEEFSYPDRAWLRHGPAAQISLKDSGLRQLENLWAGMLKVPSRVEARLAPLISNELYDTAIRELGAILEFQMRTATSSSAYGAVLANEFIDYLLRSGQHDDWSLKVLRKEIRTALKFVRNEFAHNVVELSQPRANALISRMCHVLTQIYEVT